MTETSNERREVAERLREYSNDVLKDGSLLKTLKDVTGAGSWRYVLDSLADLIDPTCKVSSVEPVEDEVGLTVGWEFHLTCGHTVEMQWNEAPVYCPECGTRVADWCEG